MHQAYGLHRRSAAWAGNAGYRDSQVDTGPRPGSFRHGDGHLFADGANTLDQLGRHAQEFVFSLVAVGDKAAVQNSR